jgi:hypothetical protein
MSEQPERCAVCHAIVVAESAERQWVDLEGLPRLFFCPSHWDSNEGGERVRATMEGPHFVRADDGTWLWVRGEVVALRPDPVTT